MSHKKIYEDSNVKIATMKQDDLTSDCWNVQFWGIAHCPDCEFFCKANCGGGKTLLNILAKEIIDRKSDLRQEFSLWDKFLIYEYLIGKKGKFCFYDLLKDKEIWSLRKVYRRYVRYANKKEEGK